MRAPLVGITTSELRNPREHVNRAESEPPMRELALGLTYPDAVVRAGGVPVIVPPYTDVTVTGVIEAIDALCVSGGPDIHPSLYGAEAHDQLGPTDLDLDRTELELVRCALARGVPVLGICRGHELLNIAMGGTLIQHVDDHRQDTPGHLPTHRVTVEAGSLLSRALGATEVEVNSFHHQAIDRLADGLRAVAWAQDGQVEGVEATDGRWVLGVQWHAEGLVEADEQAALFSAFVGAARPLRHAA